MKTFPLEEIPEPLRTMIHDAARGEVIVVKGHHGNPVAEFKRLAEPEQSSDESGHPLGSPARILEWLKENPLPEHLRRTPEEIDQIIREAKYGWKD